MNLAAKFQLTSPEQDSQDPFKNSYTGCVAGPLTSTLSCKRIYAIVAFL